MTNLLLKLVKKCIKTILRKSHRVVCPVMMAAGRRQSWVFTADYIRASTLELIAREIYEKDIPGHTAELGVYRGDFAKLINRAFPDRKLYLFDTFEGFDKRDVEVELTNNYSTGEQDFSQTSVDLVLSKMEHREQCIVKKGYFPETTRGIDEKFAFVSIDVDLYAPMYEGLQYFYDHLQKGGYIMLHDYNNDGYKGIKNALRKFSSNETGGE